MRVLLTGGAGLIGAATCKALNDQGITDIIIVDRLGKTDKWRNLVGLRYREYLEVDAFRARRLHSPCDFDAVILLGACSSTTQTDVYYLMSNNVSDMLETIEWARQPRQVYSPSGSYTFYPHARIVYASSAATYGAGLMTDTVSPVECRPLNPYGLSKNMVDQAIEARGLLDSVVGLKYFNVFGPGEAHKGDMRSVVAKGYDEIKSTGTMTLFDMPTDRPIGRDFLYVKDAAAITTWFVSDGIGQQANGLFNVGSGIASTWDQLAEALFDALERPIEIPTFKGPEYIGDLSAINRVPMPDHLKGKYQYYTKADISRLRAAGYNAPIMPLGDAVKDYVTNYLIPDRRIGT
jgi:ADP-L-glycero-D-manno-heptose 6-epimerase